MPPRHQTLPSAQTASAREAQKSFYCQLCSKGYSRMNDYEAHLSSYDHSHKQRLKDMKAMVRDPNAGSRARKAEAKADGLISIKLPGQETATGGGGFKKGGFKKSGFKSAFTKVEGTGSGATTTEKPKSANALEPTPVNPGLQKNLSPESDTEDEGYEVYDPRFPTD
ncbi:G patch domain-containing protein 8 [Fusarium austroafricanum]|uniref:G patch domain-containing protein 8 n=1 Tax=Fusarium austroafricanum TaxID=2364996 RepID=A0A8H4NRH8_9HYPO|nr:G patch domain-containing protein 8 [Fusarium austroafricanum]